jgi:hypothetical protein
MKLRAAFPALAAALMCAAQAPLAPPPAAAPPATPAWRADHAVVATIESAFESKMKGLDANEQFVLLGATSGVYVTGVGIVFTTPMDLIATPQVSPFHQVITKAESDSVHKKKMAHLPALRQSIKQAVTDAAGKLAAFPAGEKIVFAARIYYFAWEDKTGLPSQIVAAADRESALAGKIQMDEQ